MEYAPRRRLTREFKLEAVRQLRSPAAVRGDEIAK